MAALPKLIHLSELKTLNTLGLSSQAKLLLPIKSLSDLQELIASSELKKEKWFILGGGSNVVLPEKINGLVLQILNEGRSLTNEDSQYWYVTAAAGEIWDDFVQWTLNQNYFGLENLSLIPGTVGAAPIQNIGAYGVEVKDYLWQVQAVDLSNGQEKIFSNSECQFSYRDSYFKQAGAGKYLVWSVTFRLPKANQLHLEYGDISKELAHQKLEVNAINIAKAVTAIRNSKLPNPKVIGNVGSFFKNPIITAEEHTKLKSQYPNLPSYPSGATHFKLAAGWLIDQAGWKGKSLGPVGMYEKQALVLINHGGAFAQDVWRLAEQVAHDVKAQFGVTLEPEPIRW